jgi:ABC-type nitrate/sulfonate/bicarbonate transport system substrate-binding protein
MTTRFVAGLICAVLVLGLLGVGPVAAQGKKVEVRIGWQPPGGAGAFVDALMIEDRTFARHAARLGYDVTETWREFNAGPPLNEALAAGQIDIDLQKSTIPVVSAILAGIPSVPVAVTLSPLNNALLVAPNSPIKDVADLRGKTVGLVIGSSGHYLLASVIWSHFGKMPEEVGIKLVNMPAGEAIKLPKGIEVASVWPPLRYLGPASGLSEWLVDGYGKTGKAHRTPGVRLPEVEKSWAYPEGYNLDRSYVTVHQKFLDQYPDLVRAFLEARMETMNAFMKSPQRGIDNINKRLKLPEQAVKQTLAQYSEFSGVRTSPHLIESDVLALVKTSEFMAFMKFRDRPLTFDELKPLLLKGADIQRRIWEAQGSRPTVAEMEKGFTGRNEIYGDIIVKGGAPIWQWASMADWGKRAYIQGPFQAK